MLHCNQDVRKNATKELSDLNFGFFEFKDTAIVFMQTVNGLGPLARQRL